MVIFFLKTVHIMAHQNHAHFIYNLNMSCFIGSVDRTWLCIFHSCNRGSMNIDSKEVTGDYLEK